MRPKSKIYTPKQDNKQPRPFIWESPHRPRQKTGKLDLFTIKANYLSYKVLIYIKKGFQNEICISIHNKSTHSSNNLITTVNSSHFPFLNFCFGNLQHYSIMYKRIFRPCSKLLLCLTLQHQTICTLLYL